ncbi:hypothetical protein RN001_003321 [Aquatica leii]|uniref:AWS domain-containing protein n=1 Tax=Aquatica leii TaxID=1421715 RepID=A0AAN7PEU8_9COLE|nr:hypothetical protein RN001_003321 [Aquatica leii]
MISFQLSHYCYFSMTCTLTLYADPQKIKNLNTLRYHSFIKATAQNSCKKPPEEWGWKYECGILTPETMTQLPAPQSLLKMIFCTYKTGCGCRKNGLSCTVACLECNGNSCNNPSPLIKINKIDDDDNVDR